MVDISREDDTCVIEGFEALSTSIERINHPGTEHVVTEMGVQCDLNWRLFNCLGDGRTRELDQLLSDINEPKAVLAKAQQFLDGIVRSKDVGNVVDLNGPKAEESEAMLRQQCADYVHKYRRLKKEFRALLIRHQKECERTATAGQANEAVHDGNDVDGEIAELKRVIIQKDEAIGKLIGDMAQLEMIAANRRPGCQRSPFERETLQSTANNQQQPQQHQQRKEHYRSVSQQEHRRHIGSVSELQKVRLTFCSFNLNIIQHNFYASTQYLPKIWKRLGKLRSITSGLVTEQKIYEAVILTRFVYLFVCFV